MHKMDDVILVAVDATKEITDYALEWAFRNVVKSMDMLILVAVLPSRPRPQSGSSIGSVHQSRVREFLSRMQKKWGVGQDWQCSSIKTGVVVGVDLKVSERIRYVCIQMMQQLCSAHNVMQVKTKVTVISEAQTGIVAAKAGELGANWVILDRRLRKEGDCCLKNLHCNVVLIDHAIPKILRASNISTVKTLDKGDIQRYPTVAHKHGMCPVYSPYCDSVTLRSNFALDSPVSDMDVSFFSPKADKDLFFRNSPTMKVNLPNGNLHLNSQYFHQEMEGQPTFGSTSLYSKFQPLNAMPRVETNELSHRSINLLKNKAKSYSGPLKTKSDKTTDGSVQDQQTTPILGRRSTDHLPGFWQKTRSMDQCEEQIISKDSLINKKSETIISPSAPTVDRTSSIRMAMSLPIKQPPIPPPLCSVCKHNTPNFGKTPRKFIYKEIERATEKFSRKNFLAEGSYGPIYRGVLPDGQVIAVKQHKMLRAQGVLEFCSKVEALSCVQHKNLVMLVGYCIETEWLLIYEFACNGSLDKHLYAPETNEVVNWRNRMKVAIGTARGLRYLHEDCRVGCIVHMDFRPTNILLTHDYEPMVGDFGLARWQADGQSAEKTHTIGAFGYIAPEYTQTGLITEKADVYAFGVVLLELLTGLNALELSRDVEQKFFQEWGNSIHETGICKEMIDPGLEENYVMKEVECMMYAARLCVSPDPEQRPRMSKVLKILEGDMTSDMVHHYEQASACLKQNLKDGYTKDGPLNQTLSYSPSSHLLPVMHQTNSCPSSPRVGENNGHQRSIFKPITPSEKCKKVNAGGDLSQSELISEEYQAYLQGSLAKFIKNYNG